MPSAVRGIFSSRMRPCPPIAIDQRPFLQTENKIRAPGETPALLRNSLDLLAHWPRQIACPPRMYGLLAGPGHRVAVYPAARCSAVVARRSTHMGCTWSLLALSSIIWHPIGVVKRQPAWLIDRLADKLAAGGAAFRRGRLDIERTSRYA